MSAYHTREIEEQKGKGHNSFSQSLVSCPRGEREEREGAMFSWPAKANVWERVLHNGHACPVRIPI